MRIVHVVDGVGRILISLGKLALKFLDEVLTM